MKVKPSIIDALKLLSVSELSREIGCTESIIYTQIKTGHMGPDAADKYAKFLGRNVNEMFESDAAYNHETPFDVWLLENLEELPANCSNVHGKLIISEAKRLWLDDISGEVVG